MNLMRDAALIAGKDLRIEWRSRVLVAQVLPFAGMVLLLFAFALDPDRGVLSRVAPGLFWIAVLLAGLFAISRAFAIESRTGNYDGLRLSGMDGAAIFLGKTVAIALELLALEVLLLVGVYALFDVQTVAPLPAVLVALPATIGIAASGAVYGVIAAGLHGRESLLPLLLLPVLAPVMIGATRGLEAATQGVTRDAWPWVGLLAGFAVLYVTIGIVTFGPLLEDA
ncbi:MAG: heme exporter protein CcmB [Acidimicrobiia bacterium]